MLNNEEAKDKFLGIHHVMFLAPVVMADDLLPGWGTSSRSDTLVLQIDMFAPVSQDVRFPTCIALPQGARHLAFFRAPLCQSDMFVKCSDVSSCCLHLLGCSEMKVLCSTGVVLLVTICLCYTHRFCPFRSSSRLDVC